MQPRHRFREALHRRPVDRVPLWDIEFHAWHAFGQGRPILGPEFAGLPEAGRRDAVRWNAHLIAEVAVALGMDAVSAPAPWWEDAPGHPAFYILPHGWDLVQAEALAEAAQDRFAVVGNAGGVPLARYDEEYCRWLVEEPERVEAMHERMLEDGLRRAGLLVRAGCAAVFSASDLADNHGPFFRPRHVDRFVLPFLARWAQGVHALGVEAILHSDGALGALLDGLAGSGIDALQAIDPVAGMSMPVALDRVGDRLCLCGNVDCALLLDGSPAAIEAAVAALVADCAGRGSWILGCSNAVLPDTPAGNYRALVRARDQAGVCHAN